MAIHPIIVILYAFSFLTSPSSLTDEAILLDVQDRVDSIDQAGLYVLLDRISKNDITHSKKGDYIEPDTILHHPADFRGHQVWFTFLLDPSIYRIKTARPNQYSDYLYYVVGQISFGEKERMPAIILFMDEPGLIVNNGKPSDNKELVKMTGRIISGRWGHGNVWERGLLTGWRYPGIFI
jgi:hypothetical protein